jgi:predicted acetyltransferase
VRPSQRRNGYGTEIFRLAIDRARELGIIEVIVSCEKDNIAAQRVIRKNKLVKLDDAIDKDGRAMLMYSWEV